MFRCLLIALLSSRREALGKPVLRTAQNETDQKKIAVLLEALAVSDLGADGGGLVDKLWRRMPASRNKGTTTGT